jgi:hypothetical protein
MFRKAILGMVAVMGLMFVSTNTVSAYYGHRYHGGYRHGYGYGYRAPIYRPRFAYPPVYAAPPAVYGYPAVGGYGYGGYGYAPGLGVSTPGFGFYVR